MEKQPRSPHVIRLRGPWQCEPLAQTSLRPDGLIEEDTAVLPTPGRREMPSEWAARLGPAFRGRVLCRRRFGCPTGLHPRDHVHLVIQRIMAAGRVLLNQTILGQLAAGQKDIRFEITRLLKRRNEVHVEVDFPRGGPERHAGGRPSLENAEIFPFGEVRLEIHTAEGIAPET
jgi:hypothetical protein